jgi:hypothetical protein
MLFKLGVQTEAVTSPESTQKKFRGKWVDVRGRQGNVNSEDRDSNQRLKSNNSRDGDTLPWVGDSCLQYEEKQQRFHCFKLFSLYLLWWGMFKDDWVS